MWEDKDTFVVIWKACNQNNIVEAYWIRFNKLNYFLRA